MCVEGFHTDRFFLLRTPYRFVRPGPELCDSEQFKQ